jgi:hypothetical protein
VKEALTVGDRVWDPELVWLTEAVKEGVKLLLTEALML